MKKRFQCFFKYFNGHIFRRSIAICIRTCTIPQFMDINSIQSKEYFFTNLVYIDISKEIFSFLSVFVICLRISKASSGEILLKISFFINFPFKILNTAVSCRKSRTTAFKLNNTQARFFWSA